MDEADTLLKGRYRLVGLTSQNGMVAVYRAEDKQLGNRLVSVKGISQCDLSPDDVREVARQFQQEAQLLAGLNHPFLPHLYDSFQEAGRPYLVLDSVEGDTLEALLQQAPKEGLPLEEVIQIGLQEASALEYLHSRQPPIILGTLHPAMILCYPTERPSRENVRSIRLLIPGPIEMTMTSGSADYAAPEQSGANLLDSRSDIYSLGAILHHALTGNVPVPNTALRRKGAPHPIAVLPGLKVLIGQMVQPQINKRPASMTEVKQRLQALAADLAMKRLHSRLPEHAEALSPGRSWLFWNGHPLSRRTIVLGLVGLTVIGGTAMTLALARNPLLPLNLVGSSAALFTYRGHSGPVNSVAWSPNGQRIASGGGDSTVQSWDAMDGGHVVVFHCGVSCLAWSPDGRRIAASGGGMVQVWDAIDNGNVFIYRGHAWPVNAIAWSPDGQRIASGSNDGTVQVWDASDGGNVFTYRGHSGFVNAVAWSPDGQRIASGGRDQMVQIWNATDGGNVLIYRGHSTEVVTVAWSPDSQHIASGSLVDSTVHVWKAADGDTVLIYRGHSYPAVSVAWSPNGNHIVSGSTDSTAQVWDAYDGRHAFIYRGHSIFVNSVAWAPNGRLIASGGEDSTVQVWKPE